MPALTREKELERWFRSDVHFNRLYPTDIQELASRHWTPLDVAQKVAHFLASGKNARILDVGSGVGKFCLSAAFYQPGVHFYGVEQRQKLVEYAEQVKDVLQLKNVTFLNKNFTGIDFKKYDHFYFFNSFYENLDGTSKIDDSIDHSAALFQYYSFYLLRQLEAKPAGTRLATYHSLESEVPEGYHVVKSDLNDLLKFWVKL